MRLDLQLIAMVCISDEYRSEVCMIPVNLSSACTHLPGAFGKCTFDAFVVFSHVKRQND